MSLSNPSQLLLRNADLLAAQKPLFVNAPADNLVNEYIHHYPQAEVSCLNFNYQEHIHIKNSAAKPITCVFSASYHQNNVHDLVVIYFPKSKQEVIYTLAMLADAITEQATILLVGENKGGIKSAPKLIKNFINYCKKVDSARHCSLFQGIFIKQNNAFDIDAYFQHYQLIQQDIKLTVAALPGVFSQKELDVGTQLLLHNLPEKMAGKVLDFGCGAGVISAFIAKKYPQVQLSLLDVNALALESAKKTLALNKLQGHVFASDGLSQVNEKYQHVVSNPPFHQGIKTSYSATETFLTQIKNFMSKNADITLVANNFLHYQQIMDQHITKTTLITNKSGFAIYYAQIT